RSASPLCLLLRLPPPAASLSPYTTLFRSCSGTGSCTVILSAAQSVTAMFDAIVSSGCGEASCVPVQGMYISHFSGPGCTGTESYYLPYNSLLYSSRTWVGNVQRGTIHRTV